MFTKINSGGIRGIEGFFVSVEADVSNGFCISHASYMEHTHSYGRCAF